ncbi:MAG: secondary thiamine-phosphate synthase enzyme YjbQ [Xanthobacteraceae bacterium]|nr:secondary thiamine-phosphate synthase enzyme YjbQ [Xanthobacteraceae bacterium]
MTRPPAIRCSPIGFATATMVASATLTVETRGAGFSDLTAAAGFVTQSGARDGALTLFVRHTSASLTIQENADPSVRDDLMMALEALAPEGGGWSHDTEGPDDMPAHVKTMLTATALQVPVIDARLALGTWQAIYLIEHRARPHRCEVVLQFIGARSE